MLVLLSTNHQHLPIKVVLGPEETHLVGAVTHDGRGCTSPQAQQPLLPSHCHGTMHWALHFMTEEQEQQQTQFKRAARTCLATVIVQGLTPYDLAMHMSNCAATASLKADE